MSEHERRGPTEADGEREETIRDLEVPEDDAGRVSGGMDGSRMNYTKFEMEYEVKK